MIACFVEENHDNLDRFLHEFTFALRTSVNETAEIRLGRKITTPFSKLINVTEGDEYVGGNIEKLFDETRQKMRKQHKTWGKYYNLKRREVNIKVNDLVLIQTHFMSAAGRRVDVKFIPKFEGPYRVLEVRNNNLIIWKKGKKVTVSIDKVRVYNPRQSDKLVLIIMMRHYMRDRGLVGRIRENPKVLGKPRVRRRSEHGGQKRPTPVQPQGIKRTVPSSISSRNHKYRRPNSPSQGPQSIAGPSHQLDTRQCKSPTAESRQGAIVQYDRTRETRTTPGKENSAAERKPVRSRQATAVRSCPYYLRSQLKKPEGITEEQRSTGMDSLPQKKKTQEKEPQHGSLRRRSGG
ncbi:uncharacterized protein TNCV_1061231 [Trichonephila clavipes]|nr:uncharacterized protein TNCV_1061231 [Trichonephila clavipes]